MNLGPVSHTYLTADGGGTFRSAGIAGLALVAEHCGLASVRAGAEGVALVDLDERGFEALIDAATERVTLPPKPGKEPMKGTLRMRPLEVAWPDAAAACGGDNPWHRLAVQCSRPFLCGSVPRGEATAIAWADFCADTMLSSKPTKHGSALNTFAGIPKEDENRHGLTLSAREAFLALFAPYASFFFRVRDAGYALAIPVLGSDVDFYVQQYKAALRSLPCEWSTKGKRPSLPFAATVPSHQEAGMDAFLRLLAGGLSVAAQTMDHELVTGFFVAETSDKCVTQFQTHVPFDPVVMTTYECARRVYHPGLRASLVSNAVNGRPWWADLISLINQTIGLFTSDDGLLLRRSINTYMQNPHVPKSIYERPVGDIVSAYRRSLARRGANPKAAEHTYYEVKGLSPARVAEFVLGRLCESCNARPSREDIAIIAATVTNPQTAYELKVVTMAHLIRAEYTPEKESKSNVV